MGGRLLVWPNSHVHKISRMVNNGEETAVRRIVVFWLVNPDVRILSTADVARQQGRLKKPVGSSSEEEDVEEARAHRLKLMEERKRHKQDWTIREISLCEH